MADISIEPGSELLFENDRLRVWALTLDPGETCTMHRHVHDYAFVYADRSRMQGWFPESAETIPLHVDKGFVFYQQVGSAGGAPHCLTNVGTEVSTHYIFELLGASAGAVPGDREDNGRYIADPSVAS